jgi:hypothetical protein
MIARVLERLDDAINPVVVKELRQAVRSRFVVAVLLLFLLMQLGWIGLQLMMGGARGDFESSDFELGRSVFFALQTILVSTCLIFIPLYTSIRLAAERNETNVDLLYATTIRPRSIIAGKIFSAMVLAILIFSACMPFMALTYYLRGIDWTVILVTLGMDLLVVAFGVQVMVFCAVVKGNLAVRILMALAGLVGLVYTFAGTLMISSQLIEGRFFFFSDREFWMSMVASLVGVLGVGGLFYTWSVALISPPASNRALGVRLYMLMLTILAGVAAIVMSYVVDSEIPINMWVAGTTMLAVIALNIAISERREWTPRVARGIPTGIMTRLVAFPFFSGAAGGVVFSILLFAMIGVAAIYEPLWSSILRPGRFGGLEQITKRTMAASLMAFGYAYCYCMTAVLLQRVFLRSRPTLTWIVALCLFALGVAGPYFVSFFVMLDRWHYEEVTAWFVTNPFIAMAHVAQDHGYSRQYNPWVFWLFMATWAALVTVLNLRWFAEQFDRFRRSAAPSVAIPEFVAAEAVS